MAHTKSQGAVKGNRDSISKRLGLKISGGQKVTAGGIIARQRGTKMFVGIGALMGRDYTIYAKTAGIVSFKTSRGKKYINVI